MASAEVNHVLLVATEHWTSFLDKKSACDVIYFDFAKAFDSVSHDILLSNFPLFLFPPFSTVFYILTFLIANREFGLALRTLPGLL